METRNRAVEMLAVARWGRKPLFRKRRKKICNSRNCSNLKLVMLLKGGEFRSFG